MIIIILKIIIFIVVIEVIITILEVEVKYNIIKHNHRLLLVCSFVQET